MEISVPSDHCIHSLLDFWTNIPSTVILNLQFTWPLLYQAAAYLLSYYSEPMKVIILGTNKMLNVLLWALLSGQGWQLLLHLFLGVLAIQMGQAFVCYVQC